MTRTFLTFAVACVLATPVASASDGFLSFESEPGDYIGAGQSLYFADITSSSNEWSNSVQISVNHPDHWFYLLLAAPYDEVLQVGLYEGARRYPFQAEHEPGLSFYGDGRGCNTLTGYFEVHEVAYEAGDLNVLHATWTQHCEGGPTALHGEVRVDKRPLTGTVALDPDADLLEGHEAWVRGVLECNRWAPSVTVSGTVVQRQVRQVEGAFSVEVECGEEPVEWTAQVVLDPATPVRGHMQPGYLLPRRAHVEVQVDAEGIIAADQGQVVFRKVTSAP